MKINTKKIMNTTKIKLLTFYSDSHKELYETFFLDSYNKYLKDSFELNAKHINQLSPTGDYGSAGFADTMLEKINHILDNIDLSDDNVLVFADCDIQFFTDFSDKIKEQLGEFNIKFQTDVSCVCAGFFICRQNETVLNFFTDVKNELDKVRVNKVDDQQVINQFLNSGKYNAYKIGTLPKDEYFTVASSDHGARRWNGETFDVPKNIVAHHGNWTVGLDNKFKLMNFVKNEVTKHVNK